MRPLSLSKKLNSNPGGSLYGATTPGPTLFTIQPFLYFGPLKSSKIFYPILFYHIKLQGHLGTIDDFAAIPFYLSAALSVLSKSISIHSIIMICIPASSLDHLNVFYLSVCPVESSLLSQKTLRCYPTTLVSFLNYCQEFLTFFNVCLGLLQAS